MRLVAGEGAEKSSKTEALDGNTSKLGTGGLPDFLIVGTQKGGTTLLYRLLTQHPFVRPAAKKEVHYFDVHFPEGVKWYMSHFPPPAWVNGQRTITGEASPYYLYHPHAARRAAQILPDVKLIALVRNPVDRAYSDYNHKAREGRELLGFQEAIEIEEKRLEGEREKMLADESYQSINYRRFSYLSRGVYVDQIEEWHRYFARDQLLILKSEDFFDDPVGTLTSTFEFLELPPWEPTTPYLPKNSEARHEGAYEDMNPSIRRRLEAYFEPHNRKLYDYLGTTFDW